MSDHKVTKKDCVCVPTGSGSVLTCKWCHPIPLADAVKGALLSAITRGIPCATRLVVKKK